MPVPSRDTPEMSDENSVDVRLTFDSPALAIPIADALVAAGFSEVTMHVVLDARATGTHEELQLVHDRFKALGPMIDAARHRSEDD
ncbi:MAG: hypothetical protein QOH73_1684 [Gaiellaceae bacterium]|jgi:hypothetical protein|nr:hypothetical protein [Gaiellaceae bacterium]